MNLRQSFVQLCSEVGSVLVRADLVDVLVSELDDNALEFVQFGVQQFGLETQSLDLPMRHIARG